MDVMLSVCGPTIGGAKSGTGIDPADVRKHGMPRRWYKAVTPLPRFDRGNCGDANVDEGHEVIPTTESHGLWCPQAATASAAAASAAPCRQAGGQRPGGGVARRHNVSIAGSEIVDSPVHAHANRQAAGTIANCGIAHAVA